MAKNTPSIYLSIYKLFLVFQVLESTGTIGCFMLSALLSPTLNQLIAHERWVIATSVADANYMYPSEQSPKHRWKPWAVLPTTNTNCIY